MKTKFKEIVKKIKNWLSSLSKWAQKNKLKFFAILCSIFLLSCSMVTCSNNKKTASAQNIINSSSVLIMPTVTYSSISYGNVTLFPFFVGYDSGYASIYRPNITNYENRRFYYSRSTSSFDIYSLDSYQFLGYRYNTNYPQNGNREYTVLNVNNIPSTVYLYVNKTFSSLEECFNYLPLNATEVVYNIVNTDNSQSLIAVYVNGLLNNVNSTLISLQFENIMPTNSEIVVGSVPTFISSNVSKEYVAEQLLQQSYAEGYSVGLRNGFDSGYSAGISETFGNITPWNYITDAVTNFLDIKLFGDVSLNVVLYIAFGMLAFTLLVKMLR